MLLALLAGAEATRGDGVDLSTVGPLRLAVVSVHPAPGKFASVLVEVAPQRGNPANSPGISTISGWPIRCCQHTSHDHLYGCSSHLHQTARTQARGRACRVCITA